MGGKEIGDPDVLVVGGGPAGMLAAVAASLAGAGVSLLEKNGRLGRKMSITGGGRCNLTNTASLEDFVKNFPANGKFVISALSRFSGSDCINFFDGLGVPTREEEYGRVFPAGGQAGDVVAALERHLLAVGVKIFYRVRVAELLITDGRCCGVSAADGRVFPGKTVVIATGGASYPRTGSSGDGYLLARQAGHTVAPPLPGLVPLCFADPEMGHQLQGLSVQDAVVSLADAGSNKYTAERGDVIFTHFGLSGPAALRLSRSVSGQSAAGAAGMRLLLDVLPDIGEEELAGRLLSMAADQPRKSVMNILKQLIPDRLADLAAGMIGPDGRRKAGQAGKDVWRGAARLVKGLPFTLAGTRPLEEAMVTVGGVNVSEISPRTMASRLVGSLYFAGEVMDVDAYTGGFNMQIAFSTGWLAGLSAAETE